MDKILITGGTGLIGSILAEKLTRKGFEIVFLSRASNEKAAHKTYKWDVTNKTLDSEALSGVKHIIHLAGAGIADKPWSEKRKKEIIDSRVESTNLLFDTLSKYPHQIQSIVCASAIGYYGGNTGSTLLNENSEAGNDFLAHVTKLWENASNQFRAINIRTAIIRTGVVLSLKGGALPKIAMPIKFGVGACIGDGLQYISWIHIDDLCEIFVKAVEDVNIYGAYNAVASTPVTNKVLTDTLAIQLKRWVLPINVPSIALKLFLGEMSVVVLGGSNISNAKILKTGFVFKFDSLEVALDNLYNNPN